MNAALKTKNEELEKLRIRARTILTEYKTGMPAEQEVAYTAIIQKAQELKTEIEQEQKLEEKKADLAELDKFLDNPVNRVPFAANGDASEKKALLQQGWEVKGGILHAPTSLTGTTYTRYDGGTEHIGLVPMYPADVLFGEPPTDDVDAARYYKTTRAIFRPEYREAFEKYHKSSVKYRSETMAFNMLTGAEQKALSEGTDTSGGFIVPPDIQAEMLVRMPQMAVMRQMCRVQQTNRDILRWPAVAPSGSSSSIYSSGFVGGWVGETPAFTDTDASFQSFDIPIKKVRVATRLSNDFVSDAAVNILAFLASNGAENMALVEDNGFIAGIGSALQPLGILNVAGIPTTGVAGTTAHTISNTIASPTSSVSTITQLFYSLPPQYAPRARWIMRRSIEGSIRNLVDAQGRPTWFPWSQAGMAPDAPDTLLGKPIMHSDWMPTDGTANNTPLIIGDFSNYIIGQRTQITSVVLRERFADSDQVGIILFERVGGGAYNYDAFRIGTV